MADSPSQWRPVLTQQVSNYSCRNATLLAAVGQLNDSIKRITHSEKSVRLSTGRWHENALKQVYNWEVKDVSVGSLFRRFAAETGTRLLFKENSLIVCAFVAGETTVSIKLIGKVGRGGPEVPGKVDVHVSYVAGGKTQNLSLSPSCDGSGRFICSFDVAGGFCRVFADDEVLEDAWPERQVVNVSVTAAPHVREHYTIQVVNNVKEYRIGGAFGSPTRIEDQVGVSGTSRQATNELSR
jgi:hypothetical protein